MTIHATAYNDCHPLNRRKWLNNAARFMIGHGMDADRADYYTHDFQGDGRDSPSSYGRRCLDWDGIPETAAAK